MKPLLTVAIPAYNVSSTIERALSSLSARGLMKRLEILVINDGSTDDTLSVCQAFLKSHPYLSKNLQIISQPNGGHGAAINTAIRHASGQYFRILDGDDEYGPQALGAFLKQLAHSTSDLVISDYIEHRSDGQTTVQWYRRPFSEPRPLDDYLINTRGILLPFVTVKTSLLKSLRLTEHCYYDDQEFNLFVVSHTATVSYIAEPVYIYHLSLTTQSVSSYGFAKHSHDHERICLSLLKSYHALPASISTARQDYIRQNILIPLCFQQYHIAIYLKKSRPEFLSFDRALRQHPSFYRHRGIAGRRIALHRLTHGLLIRFVQPPTS